MSEIRAWHRDFLYYRELIAIECVTDEGVRALIHALWSDDLRTCPHDVVGNSVIVPKEAMEYLPLGAVEHEIVELRATYDVSEEVLREVRRRFSASRNEPDEQPHFYICGQGYGRVVCKNYVTVDRIREIERVLSEKEK